MAAAFSGLIRFPPFDEEKESEKGHADDPHSKAPKASGATAQDSSLYRDIDSYDLPFAAFGVKFEKIWRVAELVVSSAAEHAQHHHGHGAGTAARRRGAATAAAAASKSEEIDEEGGGSGGWTMTIADRSASSFGQRRGLRPRGPVVPSSYGSSVGAGAAAFTSNPGRGGRQAAPGGWGRGSFISGSGFAGRRGQLRGDNRGIIREPSVKVLSEWKLLDEIEFGRLAKLQLDPDDPTELSAHGTAFVYDRGWEKVSAKNDKPIPSSSGPASSGQAKRRSDSSSLLEDDGKLLALAKAHSAQLIVADSIASLLMACQRTVMPWDIVVRRRGNLIILDKRPETNTDIVFSANETAGEAPSGEKENLNSYDSLANELGRIAAQLPPLLAKVGEPAVAFGEPEQEEGPVTRYSLLELGDDIRAIVRGTYEMLTRLPASASVAVPQSTKLVPLLEFEQKSAAGMDWRLRLDTQRGAVLAHEIRNNSAYLARSVFQALLSNIELLRIAYVSRQNARDRTKHTLLGLQEFGPYELAAQMNLNIANGFGILRAIVDICRRLPTNTDYLLLRDPNKAILRLYRLPGGAADENVTLDAIDELVPAGTDASLAINLEDVVVSESEGIISAAEDEISTSVDH